MPHIDRRCGSRTYSESKCDRVKPRDDHPDVLLKLAVSVGLCLGPHASTLPERHVHQSVLRSTLNEVPKLIVHTIRGSEHKTLAQ